MGIFNQILSPNTGALNFVLTKYFGLKKTIYFLGDNRWFRPTLIATDIWKNVGWGTILYLAVIAGIDPELYEAAVCDGATRLQRMRHITIPALMPTISILLILNVGGILDAGFDQIFNMYNSAVLETGDIIDTYVYRAGLGSSQYSIATAVGLFKNIIGFILLMGTNKIAGRLGGRGIW
jgi:putative aldouronate transport system permease protein